MWKCSQGQKLSTREPPAAQSLLLRHVAPAQAGTTAIWSYSSRHRAQTKTLKDLNSLFRDVLDSGNTWDSCITGGHLKMLPANLSQDRSTQARIPFLPTATKKHQ